MQDGNYYSKLDDKDEYSQINKYSFRFGQKIRTLIDSKNLEIDINNYTFSNDEKKLLLPQKQEKILQIQLKIHLLHLQRKN